jgi:hypothetical protein
MTTQPDDALALLQSKFGRWRFEQYQRWVKSQPDVSGLDDALAEAAFRAHKARADDER